VADLINPHNICGWVGENVGVHEDVPVAVDLPPLPDNFFARNPERRPLPVQYICCSHNRLSQAAPWNETNYRHYLAAYYHYLHRVDAEIGLILDALEARPDAEDTLIVFMSDHGDGMAVHRMVTKQVSMYDNTTRIPLAFAGPGVRGRDRVDENALVSNLDLLPTLCDYAGLDAPIGLWGKSLLPWLQGTHEGSPHAYVASEWHTEWGYTISPGRMVRTNGYKYTRYLEGDGEELYDLRADPGETLTLVDDPAYTSVLEQHRALLDEHVKDTGDDFVELAWRADRRWRSHKPGYEHHIGPAAPMVG
jgi:choline-sulfatase